MADSITTIANLALQKIGADRITSVDDDVREAREFRACYAPLRDGLLRRHRWNFATRRENLASVVGPAPIGYAYRFALPADFLRLYEVGEYYPGARQSDATNGDVAEWRVEGGFILSNEAGPLRIRYCARIDNPVLHDALFDEALTLKVAHHLAEILTNSAAKRDMLDVEFRRVIREARSTDAIEDPPDVLPDNDWIMARI